MKTRIITILVGLAVFIPFIVKGGPAFALAMTVLGVIGLWELGTMKGVDSHPSVMFPAMVGLVAVMIPDHYAPGFMGSVNLTVFYYLACIILLTLTVFRHKTFDFVDASTLMFGAIYIGVGFRFIIEARDLGLATLMYLFLTIWSSDSGAYLIGRAIGKTKLAPEISPNKTVEGALGGVVTALIVSSVYTYFFPLNLGDSNYSWLLTAFISIVGQFGDLVESAYKRHFNVKDSGKLFPGHGGVLDRFDSLIFASFSLMIWLNFFR